MAAAAAAESSLRNKEAKLQLLAELKEDLSNAATKQQLLQEFRRDLAEKENRKGNAQASTLQLGCFPATSFWNTEYRGEYQRPASSASRSSGRVRPSSAPVRRF